MRACSDTKKPPEGGFFVGGKRITSFRQREQQVQQRVQRLRQQQEQVQMRQQPVRVQQQERVRVQERGFLFCHKRPKRRPSERPRGVIFS
jgi:hypothetical protein